MNKELYTKVFLNQLGKSTNDISVAEYMPLMWKNTRQKDVGGLRLTEYGFDIIGELDLAIYEVPFPFDMQLTTQVIIHLDKFIDCPYYLTDRSVYVTNEKKAVELTLFSGNIRKYGMNKAMKEQDADSESTE
jgi:hypothetical protein